METVMVVGAGFMGSGIAQVCAQAGYGVHLMDVHEESLNKAIAGINSLPSEQENVRTHFTNGWTMASLSRI